MHRGGRRGFGALAAALLAAGACGDRGRPPPAADAAIERMERRVELRLVVPREWTWNEEDTLRVRIVNGTPEPFAGALHLFVAFPVDLAGTAAGDEVLSSGEGTRVTVPVRLAPGEAAEFARGVRTPPAAAGDTAGAFAVRAWVAAPDGAERAAAADTIRVRGTAAPVAGGCASAEGAALTRYGVGPLRLDMQAADVRTLCPEARDTAWRGPGSAPRPALALRIGGRPVLALLDGERVAGVVVDSAGLATPAGIGVGSTLAELRARYGRTCTAASGPETLVTSPAAPGIAFAVDPGEGAAPGAEPPDTARVARLRVRADTDPCAPPARSEPEPQEGAP